MARICCIKECDLIVEARSMCNVHYTRTRLHGDPLYENGYRHLMSRSPEYNTWNNMKQRCRNPNNTFYKDYGGRGITVCARWLTFQNFLEDMGERPSEGYSIDRIDVDGNYEPENCRWATRSVQSSNVRPTNSTGVKNVYKVSGANRFMVVINRVYHGSYKTVDEATVALSAIKEKIG